LENEHKIKSRLSELVRQVTQTTSVMTLDDRTVVVRNSALETRIVTRDSNIVSNMAQGLTQRRKHNNLGIVQKLSIGDTIYADEE
jgi:hypothetical protein